MVSTRRTATASDEDTKSEDRSDTSNKKQNSTIASNSKPAKTQRRKSENPMIDTSNPPDVSKEDSSSSRRSSARLSSADSVAVAENRRKSTTASKSESVTPVKSETVTTRSRSATQAEANRRETRLNRRNSSKATDDTIKKQSADHAVKKQSADNTAKKQSADNTAKQKTVVKKEPVVDDAMDTDPVVDDMTLDEEDVKQVEEDVKPIEEDVKPIEDEQIKTVTVTVTKKRKQSAVEDSEKPIDEDQKPTVNEDVKNETIAATRSRRSVSNAPVLHQMPPPPPITPSPKKPSDLFNSIATPSVMFSPSKEPKRTPVSNKSEQQQQQELFCICRQPYDERMFYIQCDACDEWFHGKCVGMRETSSYSIEKWFCQPCSTAKGLAVVTKPKCKRNGCRLYVRDGSQVCSDLCGVIVARSLFVAKQLALVPRKDYAAEWQTAKDTLKAAIATMESQTRLYKLLIRSLEARQLRIDEAIERAHLLNVQLHPPLLKEDFQLIGAPVSSILCAFDSRITDQWLVPLDIALYVGKSLSETLVPPDPVSQEPQTGTTEDTAMDPSKSACETPTALAFEDMATSCHYRPTMCVHRGKCSLHDDWRLMKQQEVEQEITTQMALLKNVKAKRIEYEMRLRALDQRIEYERNKMLSQQNDTAEQ